MSFNDQIDKSITFFETKARLGTLDSFVSSLRQNVELIVLSGEQGTGKTLFIERALRDLRGDIFPLMLLAARPTFAELLEALFEQTNFSQPIPKDGMLETDYKQQQVRGFLARQVEINRQVAIFVDDAHVLDIEALIELLSLAAPAAEGDKFLCSIVLSGSLELNALALNSAIVKVVGKSPTIFQLHPLGSEEIKAFIRSRLSRYKFKEKELFAPLIITKIMSQTQGAIRLLDSLFDSVILFADSSDKISLAGFNEAFDFFSLLVQPSMSTGEGTSKSLFYDANEPAKSSLVSSLKDKISHLFAQADANAVPDEPYSNTLIAHEPFEYVNSVSDEQLALEMDGAIAKTEVVVEPPPIDQVQPESTTPVDEVPPELTSPSVVGEDIQPEQINQEALGEQASPVDALTIATETGSVVNEPAKVDDFLAPLVVKTADAVNAIDAIAAMNMDISLVKTDDETMHHLKSLIAEYQSEMNELNLDFPVESVVSAAAMPVISHVEVIEPQAVETVVENPLVEANQPVFKATEIEQALVIEAASQTSLEAVEGDSTEEMVETLMEMSSVAVETSPPVEVNSQVFTFPVTERVDVVQAFVSPNNEAIGMVDQEQDVAVAMLNEQPAIFDVEAELPNLSVPKSSDEKLVIPFLYPNNKAYTEEPTMMNRSEGLSKALQAFKDISPDVDAAAIISNDGLMIASVLPQGLDDVSVGGMSATLLSLGTRCVTALKRGKVEEVIVRGESGYAIMLNAGRDTMLLAVTNADAKLGLITFDMREAIKKIADIL